MLNSDTIIFLVGFLVFINIQSLIINGAFIAFSKDHILYPVKRFFESREYLSKISKPLFTCVKCMSSVWGGLTFWPIVLLFYGFHWIEIYVYVVDVFCLVYLNFFYYKKL